MAAEDEMALTQWSVMDTVQVVVRLTGWMSLIHALQLGHFLQIMLCLVCLALLHAYSKDLLCTDKLIMTRF